MDYRWFDAASDAIFALNSDRRAVYLNAAAAALTGVAADARTPPSFDELIRLDDPELVRDLEAATRLPAPFNAGFLTPGAERCQALIQVTQAPESSALSARWLVLVREVGTKQRKAETETLSKVRKVIATVSHDLNNPLAIAASSVDMMMPCLDDEPLEPALIKEVAGFIQGACQRMVKLSQNLKNLGRTALLPQELVETSPRQIVDSACAFMQPQTKKACIEVVVSLPENLPNFRVERSMMELILISLIRNTFDELKHKGSGRLEISVRYDAPTERIILRVADDGPGLAPEIADRVFAPFVTTRGLGSGTGLGLHVCATLAELHAGSLTVVPKGPPGLALELAVPTAPNVDLESQKIAAAQGKRILVAHSSAPLRRGLTQAIAAICATEPAQSGVTSQELGAISRGQWDLVFLEGAVELASGSGALPPVIRIVEEEGTEGSSVPRAFTYAILAAKIRQAFPT